MEEDRMPKKIFTQELEGTRRRGRPRKGWREEVERDLQVLGVRKWRELVIDRDNMERYCSTGQSPQRAVAPTEEEEEGEEEEEEISKQMYRIITYLPLYDITCLISKPFRLPPSCTSQLTKASAVIRTHSSLQNTPAQQSRMLRTLPTKSYNPSFYNTTKSQCMLADTTMKITNKMYYID
jgi:hypothetical protein